MTARAILQLALASLLLASPALPSARGQTVEETTKRLQAKPPGQWTRSDGELLVRQLTQTIAEGVLDYFPEPERQRIGAIEVVIGTWEDAAPATMAGRELRLQVDHFLQAFQLSGLLAHDLRLEYLGELPNPQPLLTTPYARSILIPVLRPLLRHADSMPLWNSCPREIAGCEPLIMASAGAVLGFVIAHELAHRALSHNLSSKDKSYLLADEIAADRLAATILESMRVDLSSGHQYLDAATEHVFAAGPLLVLESQRERLATEVDEYKKSPEDEAALGRRLQAYARLLTPKLRQKALASVLASTSEANAGRLVIHFEEPPDLLVINGLEVPPTEVRGRELRVTSGIYRVFARAGERFAFARTTVWDPEPSSVYLRFLELVTRTSASELQQLEDERRWIELLRRTSRPDLTPNSHSVASQHFLALRRMHLYRWIDPNGWGALTGRDLRFARIAARRGQPLFDWLP